MKIQLLLITAALGFSVGGQSFAQSSLGATTAIPSYLESLVPGVSFQTIRSVADGTSNGLPQMAGIPDGLGAFDNNNGTFTVLMNHELGYSAGTSRAHGAAGSFISRWVINKSDLTVSSITDQFANYQLYTGSGAWSSPTTGNQTYISEVDGVTANVGGFNRFCSADLAASSAFFNPSNGFGTQARIFLTGEETSSGFTPNVGGRAFATVVDSGASTLYQLPDFGKTSFENIVASPFAQNKTIALALDDNSSQGQVYVYIGEKRNIGNDFEKAGLVGGTTYAVQAISGGLPVATETSSAGSAGLSGSFSLVNVSSGTFAGNNASSSGNLTLSARDMNSIQFNSLSLSQNATSFARPEDGVWGEFRTDNGTTSGDFYFLTTATVSTESRLYKMTFQDMSRPELGGDLTCLLTSNSSRIKMGDNLTYTNGMIYIQEDPGGNADYASIWEYNTDTLALREIAKFDDALFANSNSQGAFTFNWDEESSGILDVSEIFGEAPGTKFLVASQVHTSANGTLYPGAVEHGQLSLMTVPEPSTYALLGIGALAFFAWRRSKAA